MNLPLRRPRFPAPTSLPRSGMRRVCGPVAGAALLAFAFAAAPAPAQDAPATPNAAPSSEAIRERNRQAVADEFAARKAQYDGNDRACVLPGVLALRDADGARVELTAEATSIEKNAIVEFVLIGEASGHDYEALFVSLATARDIDAALKFIGMVPGRNAYARPMDFWPKGPRVMVSLKAQDGRLVPVESLLFDRRDGASGDATLPVRGFVYCGSGPARGEKDALAADYDGPCSILSTYNEPTTLIDVPRKASQNEAYESCLANPAPGVKAGDLVTLVLAPERRDADEGPRVADLALRLRESGNGLVCDVSKADHADIVRDATPEAAFATLAAMSGRIDPYVTLEWDDSVTFGSAARLAALLDSRDNEDGIRVEAPRDGEPYYRAFLPDPAWLDRAQRPTQPLELRFARNDAGAVSATLVSVSEIWPEDGSSLNPTLQATDIPVPSPEALPALAAGTGNEIPALLVYVPAPMTLGDVLPFVRTVQAKRSNVYFFVDAAR